MLSKAYVLIQTVGGRTGQVLQALRGRKGIVAVDAVTGLYDVIAIVEGKDPNDIGRIVHTIDEMDGVTHTDTLAVELG